MAEDVNEEFKRIMFGALNEEFETFNQTIKGLAQSVCEFKKELKAARLFGKEEQFMLTMEFQTVLLNAMFSQPQIHFHQANGESQQEEDE